MAERNTTPSLFDARRLLQRTLHSREQLGLWGIVPHGTDDPWFAFVSISELKALVEVVTTSKAWIEADSDEQPRAWDSFIEALAKFSAPVLAASSDEEASGVGNDPDAGAEI